MAIPRYCSSGEESGFFQPGFSRFTVEQSKSPVVSLFLTLEGTRRSLVQELNLRFRLQSCLTEDQNVGRQFAAGQQGRRALAMYAESLHLYSLDLQDQISGSARRVSEASIVLENAKKSSLRQAKGKAAAAKEVSDQLVATFDKERALKEKTVRAYREEVVVLEKMQRSLFTKLYPGCPSEATCAKLFCPLTGRAMHDAIMLRDGTHVSAASLGLSIDHGELRIDPRLSMDLEDYDLAAVEKVFGTLFGSFDRDYCKELLQNPSHFYILLDVYLPCLKIDHSVAYLAQHYSLEGGSLKDPAVLRPIAEEWVQDPVLFDVFENPETLSCGHSFSAKTIQQLEKYECPLCRKPIKSEQKNEILQAFAEEFVLSQVSLEQRLADIQREMERIEALTKSYEQDLLDLQKTFTQVVTLTLGQEIQQKEDLIRRKQEVLIELECKIPYLKALQEHWMLQLQAVREEKEDSKAESSCSEPVSRAAQEKELARLGFMKSLAFRSAQRLELSMQEDALDSQIEKKRAKEMRNKLYEETKHDPAILEAFDKERKATTVHLDLLKKWRDAEERWQEAFSRLQDLRSHPLHHTARELVQLELERPLESFDISGKEDLTSYIDQKLTSSIQEKRHNIEMLSIEIFKHSKLVTTMELISLLGAVALAQLRQSYDTFYFSSEKVIPLAQQGEIASLLEENKKIRAIAQQTFSVRFKIDEFEL